MEIVLFSIYICLLLSLCFIYDLYFDILSTTLGVVDFKECSLKSKMYFKGSADEIKSAGKLV